ncbi:MAG: hypothetical protein J6N67_03150, partial [Desulfovibrio sp.]|nr:hypothetical protein [Desulfovibrio sp.]
MPDDAARNALTRARASLVAEHPFFGALALRLRFRPDPACADLWTDGKTLAFNPAFASALPDAALTGALAHEVLHLALGHHLRRQGRNEKLWNRACDFAVNQVLLESGFILPQGFAHDPAYAGLHAEEIYASLAALHEQSLNRGARSALAAQEASAAEGADSAPLDGGTPAPEPGTARSGSEMKRSKGQEAQDEAAGNKASDKRGTARKEKDGAASFIGEVRDHPAVRNPHDEAARRGAEQELDIAVTQSLQRAAHMGSLPAGLARRIKRAWRPHLDWRALLRQFLEECARNDYTWTTPNRRYIYQDIYLPSRREACLERVVLAVDCSGSVDEPSLAMFCAELSSVLEAFDATLTVIFHDTIIHNSLTITRMDLPVRLEP